MYASSASALPMRHIQAHSQAEASGVKHQVRPQRQASTETRHTPRAATRTEFPYFIKARCARSAGGANGAHRSSPTRPPHTPPRRINGRSRPGCHRHHDPASGGEISNHSTARLQRPAYGATPHPFPPGCLTPLGRIEPRAAPSAAAMGGRRRAASMSSPPAHVAARPSPPAAATFQHRHGDER